MKKLVWFLIIVIIVLLIIILTKTCCPSCNQTSNNTPANSNYPHIAVNPDQLVLWKKPNISADSFHRWIISTFKDPALNVAYCKDCDSSLVLLTATNIILDPTGQTSNQGSKTPTAPPSGDDGPAYYSFNFPVVFRDTVFSRYFNSRTSNFTDSGSLKDSIFRVGALPPLDFVPGDYHHNDKVTVAVFDTGVDSVEMVNYLYHNANNSCLGNDANDGWNFYNHTANWKDDYMPTLHGSVVARLIEDQGLKYKNNIVNILPVKIHSSNGVSYLYDVLCALQYAKNRKANIINASFGYYSPRLQLSSGTVDSAALFFKSYLTDYFSGSNMLMVAAAGNMDNVNEDAVYPAANTADKRNLDSVNFFPASFARDIPNIIAVTTVSNSTNNISPHQNFSANVVDIGVNADITADTLYLFRNPRDPTGAYTVEGSSFAAPIAAGKIAANYYLVQGMLTGAVVDKEALLNILSANSLIQSGGAAFPDKIKAKRIMMK